MKIFRRKGTDTPTNFINKTVIGLGYGLIRTRDFILNRDLGITTQDAMDALSIWIGRELMKEMLDKNVVKVRDSDDKLVNALMSVVNLAEELDVEVTAVAIEEVNLNKIKLLADKLGVKFRKREYVSCIF